MARDIYGHGKVARAVRDAVSESDEIPTLDMEAMEGLNESWFRVMDHAGRVFFVRVTEVRPAWAD
jgi:hypothetical protein